MDSKQLEYFKNRLLQKQLSLSETVHRTEDYGREQDQDTRDLGDMALESYTKEFLFGKSAGDREILLMIQEALNRIKDESFGFCRNCEDPISEKRLEAVPWAGYCISCQDLKEKGLLK